MDFFDCGVSIRDVVLPLLLNILTRRPIRRFVGQPLEGSLNITVVDGMTGQPLPGAQVVVTNVGQPGRWTGTTNDAGQVTISDEGLRLPASATASLEGYTTTTFERLTVENATLVLVTQTPPMGMGNMDPVEPVQLIGRIQGLDRIQKPSNEGFSLVCFIETTHSNPGNRLGAPAPLPNGLLVEDGPFDIFVGAGEFAVVAVAGYVPAVMKLGYEEGQVPYWTFRDALQPVRMGMRRFVTASPGDVINGLNVELDIPMDQRAEVRLCIRRRRGRLTCTAHMRFWTLGLMVSSTSDIR